MLDEVRQRADEFDILHFHIDLLHFPFFQDTPWRTLTTLHGRLDMKDLPQAYACWPQFPLVSISDHQRRPLPAANWAGTVHHGVPTELYEYQPDAARRLPRVPRTHLAGEACRPRDRDRAPRRPAAANRREGRRGGPRVLP